MKDESPDKELVKRQDKRSGTRRRQDEKMGETANMKPLEANPQLTIFYDGTCPLCVSEMQQLRVLDSQSEGPVRIAFADIYQEGFRDQYPEIDPQQADRILHGRLADGTLLLGLDVSCCAWQLVGRKPWLQVLRWPIVRWLADGAYWLFARNRYRLSWLLTGQRRCRSCELTDR